MRTLLILLAAVVCLFAPRALAILTIETTEGKVWVWQKSEMDMLMRDMNELMHYRDEWKRKAEAERVCL